VQLSTDGLIFGQAGDERQDLINGGHDGDVWRTLLVIS